MSRPLILLTSSAQRLIPLSPQTSHDGNSRRWNLLSWMTPFVALALLVFLLTASIGQGQGNSPAHATRALLVCTMSSFFSIDANEQISDVIHIEGRGLATCKNDQGATSEFPVFAEMEAKAVGHWANAGELSFSANSATFVVPHDITQIQGRYNVRPADDAISGSTKNARLFENPQNDLLIEMKLSSHTEALQKLVLTGLALRMDESAPTLE